MKSRLYVIIFILITSAVFSETIHEVFPYGDMKQNRMGHIHFRLQNGDVILLGGHGTNFVSLSTAEIYSPYTDTSKLIQMNFPHDFAAAAKANNGKYYVFGGSANLGVAPGFTDVEYFDESSKTFVNITNKMNYGRMNHAAVLMNNGNILIAGGWYNGTSSTYAEVFDPTTNTFTVTGAMITPRALPILVPTTDGKVTIFGGMGVYGGNNFQNIEEFNPITNEFTKVRDTIFSNRPNISVFFNNYLPGSNNFSDFKYLFQAYDYDAKRVFFFTFNSDTKEFTEIDIDHNFNSDGFSLITWAPSDFYPIATTISAKYQENHTLIKLCAIFDYEGGYGIDSTYYQITMPGDFHYLSSASLDVFQVFQSLWWNNLLLAGGTTSNDFHTNFNPVKSTYIITSYDVGVEQEDLNLPNDFSLSQNYPNPFNPSTTIKFAVNEGGFVSLTVYDILGKEVATLVNQDLAKGSYSVNFNSNTQGLNLASGMYIYKLNANNNTLSKKMLLLK